MQPVEAALETALKEISLIAALDAEVARIKHVSPPYNQDDLRIVMARK
jgi:hypothetical protein